VESKEEPYAFAVEPTSVDLGVLRPDQDASFTFTIVNHDARPLKLVNIDGSCECVAFAWKRGDVAPGGRVDVRTEVRARNRGSKLLTVYVQANDRVVTTRQIGVRYLVQPDLVFAPERVAFGRRHVGSSAVVELTVAYQMPTDAEPITLVPKVDPSAPVEVRESAPPERVDRPGGLTDVTSRLEVVLDTARPVAAFEAALVFGSDRHLPARLPVTGSVHRGLYLDPDQIHLGIGGVGANRRGTARLMWTREEPRIEAIECDPPELSAVAVRESGARAFRIQVSFEARSRGELEGVVRIRTNLDPEPLLLQVKGRTP